MDDAVEQPLDALVLEGGAAEDRHDSPRERGLANHRAQVLEGNFLALAIAVEDRLVELADLLDQVAAPLRGDLDHVRGDRAFAVRHALVGVVVVDRLLRVEVHEADEVLLFADGDDDGHGVGAERVLHLADHGEEVRAGAVELVDEGDAGHVVFFGLAPDGLRLRLDAADAAEERDGAVEDAQRALDLGGEVHVAGGVNQVDAVVAPVAGGGGGGDGDAALALLLHPVHRRVAVVHVADAVGAAGVEEDAFGAGGLAGINVRHDADVADSFKRHFSGHRKTPAIKTLRRQKRDDETILTQLLCGQGVTTLSDGIV